jgi:hypothetical protein
MTETAAPTHRLTGNWRPDRQVPTSGWSFAGGLEDRGLGRHLCEMCETHRVRFVHEMAHPDYPRRLRVGGDCAGFMEGDAEGARRRDTDFRNRQARRLRWISAWHLIDEKNPAAGQYRNLDRFHFQVRPDPEDQGWVGSVSYRSSPIRWVSSPFPDLVEAKLATFDKLGELRPAAEEWKAAEKARLEAIAAEARRRAAVEQAEARRMNRGQLTWQRSASGNWYTEVLDQEVARPLAVSTRLVISPSRRWSGKWGISIQEGQGAWTRVEAYPSEDAAWKVVEDMAAELRAPSPSNR